MRVARRGRALTAERGTDVTRRTRASRTSREPRGACRRRGLRGADAPGLGQLLFRHSIGGLPLRIACARPISSQSRTTAAWRARGGTLFLQDVTELPAAIQARLARIARDGEMLLDGAPYRPKCAWSPTRRQPLMPCARAPATARFITGAGLCTHRLTAAPGPPGRRAGDRHAHPRRSPDGAGAEAPSFHASRAGPGGCRDMARKPWRTSGGHHARRRRAGRSRHPGGAHSAGASSAAGACAVCAHREPARSAAAVRAGLHFGGPSAPRMANGRRCADPRYSASQPLSKGAPAWHSCHTDVRVAFTNGEQRDNRYSITRGSGAFATECTIARTSQKPAPQTQPAKPAPHQPEFVIPNPQPASGQAPRPLRPRHRSTR